MKRILRKVRRAFRYGEKGFTLIELLIVVAILGILAAVIIPNVSTFLVTGRINAANTEVENIKTASLAYYAEYSAWPSSTSSANFTAFLAGVPAATYTFDATYGWVMNTTAGGYTGASFSAGSAGSTGHSGKWVRSP